MKLKYILPVATIASVATIVTPLVTSCAQKKDTAQGTKGTEYKPLDPKGKVVYESIDKLTEGYHNEVYANRFVFADDMVNYGYESSLSNTPNRKVYEDVESVSYTIKSVGDIETISPSNSVSQDIGNSYFRLTFDVKLSATITIDLSAESGPISNLVYDDAVVNVVDLPVHCIMAGSSDNQVFVEPLSDAYMLTDTKGSIKMPEVKCSQTYEYSGGSEKTYNNVVLADLDPETLQPVLSQFCMYLAHCKSNYFSEAELSK